MPISAVFAAFGRSPLTGVITLLVVASVALAAHARARKPPIRRASPRYDGGRSGR